MYKAVTHDIQVTVLPEFLADRSDPDGGRFFWAYTIEIANLGRIRVQLVSREWHITDAAGRVEDVRGQGVVGEQPVLNPRRDVPLHVRLPARDAERHHGGPLLGDRRHRAPVRGRNSRLLARQSACGPRAELMRDGAESDP